MYVKIIGIGVHWMETFSIEHTRKKCTPRQHTGCYRDWPYVLSIITEFNSDWIDKHLTAIPKPTWIQSQNHSKQFVQTLLYKPHYMVIWTKI